MGINRRTFLGGTVAAVAALKHADLLAASPDFDLVDVTGTDPKAMAKAAIDALGGIGKFVRKGDYVVLKPNAGFANPMAWGTTTHPDTVVAIAQLCLEAKAKQVLILENPVSRPEKCFERCGLTAALAAIPEVKAKLLVAGDFQKVEIKGAKALKSTEAAKALLSADVFINIPAAKQHNQSGVSFGLKNHMGLIQDRQVFHQMLDLNQAIADLALLMKPQLTLLDATRALLTNGPAGPGETSTPGRMVAGKNVVSVDAYGLTVARFNNKQMTPADAPHIEMAAKLGLGVIDLEKLKVKKVTV